MKIKLKHVLFISLIRLFVINSKIIASSNDIEEQKINVIIEIVFQNLKYNGRNNILIMGHLPDTLFHSLSVLPFTFAVTNIEGDDGQIEDVIPYQSNVIIMSCADLDEFEKAMKKIVTLPYWHSLAKVILYYHSKYHKETIAKIFFIYWFYRAINVIIVQYDETEKEMLISYYSPYMTEKYMLTNVFGCWKAKKIGLPIQNFEKSFKCDKQCLNMTSYTKIRALHLGTCLGFETEKVQLTNLNRIQKLNIFEDKGKNLHGFTLYAYTVEVLPFLKLEEHEDGTYTYHRRDGMIWNTMAELFNFKIDITPAKKTIKEKFDYEINVLQVFSFAQRKADLILFPLYQFDLIIAEIDYTVPFIDSGVCILSHRAQFETIVFDVNLLEKNISTIIQFILCFICTWFVFFIYNTEQSGRLSLDQAGKDLINTFKTVLSISICNPPKRGSFRIFLTISIWSFFVINFSTQAAIISLFSVHKREKEVDTFEDIINKGYKIEGIASPDVVLPDTEELYRIITSRIEAVHDLFGCVKQMENDSHRFCLMDCAVGRYLAKNMLNKKGQQFLHLASHARIHSHYLNMILHKNSPLTEHFNKYILILFESGLIRKWMDYKYIDIKEEATIKPLGMDDLGGIFECYGFFLGISIVVNMLELLMGFIHWIVRKCSKNTGYVQNKSILSSLSGKLTRLMKFRKRDQTDEITQTI